MSELDVDLLDNLDQPSLSRAIAILSAIEKNKDFNFVIAKSWERPDGVNFELLIVILTCDGVPDVNSYGIEYQEKLGILVSPNDNDIPEVWTLRSDFPDMIHMNDRPAGMPNSLCLYFETKTVINRTWTAEKFLKRIYWWIENSAKGTLHEADQPVEQFFFNSKYELVLENGCGDDPENIGEEAFISNVARRKDGSCTFFLETNKQEMAPNQNGQIQAHVIVLEFPPITQGTISPNPYKLAEFYQTMVSAGVSAKDFLKDKIQSLVSSEGLVKSDQECRTIIFVKIPIAREDGGKEERVQLRAFLTIESPIEIGEKSGFLIQSPGDNTIYKDVMCDGRDDSVPDIDLFPVEVLKLNSKDDYRLQSGGEIKGDKYTLIGLGALGSVLFDLWNRAGWGEWVLIDKDHIKPHNLTRHMGGIHNIGWNKALACADRAHYCTGNIDGLIHIDEDAMSLSDTSQQEVSKTSLVIDVSTTLDYPRLASFEDCNPRHCTLFITPSGNDAVLLLEDDERSCRLRTIETQYYRAVIENKWGENHLASHLGSFVSGGSCRDISLKLPFSSVVGHASVLSEQVMILSGQPGSAIRIWRKNKASGSVQCIETIASNEIQYEVDKYQIFIDFNLEQKINSMREANLPSETGGILLGYHDLNLDSIFIVDALSAPPDSVASETGFQRGTQGVMDSVETARSRTANIVDYIGEWHSHPRHSEANQSGLDVIQLTTLSKLLAEDGLPAVQLIVGENGINIILGEISSD